jgi:hypothetical protein
VKSGSLRFPTWYPIGRKAMEKSTNSGISFDGIGGYFQGFRRGVENCKTFMRRFDPDPRLQFNPCKINKISMLDSFSTPIHRCVFFVNLRVFSSILVRFRVGVGPKGDRN